MIDFHAPAIQVEFAAIVGASQPAIAKHFAAGTLVPNGTYRQWLLAYCERLRTEAAGRTPTDARERRDIAAARKDEAAATLAERELLRQEGLIVELDSVRRAMLDWATTAKNEFIGAIDSVITAIESAHGITIDRTTLQPDIDAALRAIGSYEIETEKTGA